ncbi:hypothetical protein WP2S18C03_25090 [Aeromonas veronii]|nr:hypothetical protein WP2S18C03_25090 [Aeromonas veronii]
MSLTSHIRYFFQIFVLMYAFSPFAFSNDNQPNARAPFSSPYEQTWLIQQIVQLQERSVRLETEIQKQSINGEEIKNAEKELQEIKVQLVEIKEKLEFQTENNSKELTGYDRRISDISWMTNFWGGVLSIFGLLITVAAIFMGWTATKRAISEAKIAAQQYFNQEGRIFIEAEQARFEELRKIQMTGLQTEHASLQAELRIQNEQLLVQSREFR